MTTNNSVPRQSTLPKVPGQGHRSGRVPRHHVLGTGHLARGHLVDCVIRCQALRRKAGMPPVHSHYLVPYEDAAAKSPGDACLPLRKNEGTAAHTGGWGVPGAAESNEFIFHYDCP